jgi:hypothetical protein
VAAPGVNKYAIAAELAGVELVASETEGMAVPVKAPGHEYGPKVFWPQQRVTSRGLYRFLGLAWTARWARETRGMADWIRLYRKSTWVQGIASDMGVRLPRSLFELDRARLREMLSEAAAIVPPHLREDEYKEALRWAER